MFNLIAKLKSFNWKSRLQQGLTILVLSVCLYLSYYVAGSFYRLEPQIKVALITVASGFALVLITNYVQRKRELDFKIREKKIDAYQKFFDFLLHFLKSTNSGDQKIAVDGIAGPLTPGDLVPRIYEVNYALIVSGSDVIIRRWRDFLQSLKSQNFAKLDKGQAVLHSLMMRQSLGEIILLIRKDLGHIDKAVDLAVISDLFLPINFTEEDWAALNATIEKSGLSNNQTV